MEWKQAYQDKLCTAEEAARLVKSGETVFFGTASSQPYRLAEALYQRREELTDVTVCTGLTVRPLPYFTPEAKGHFSTLTYFAGPGERRGIQCGQTQFTSFHLSQVDLWCRETAHPDVAFLEVSPPDGEGNMSYGAYGVSMHDAIRACARRIVLQVNRFVPYVFGERNTIHVSQADAIVEADEPLDEFLAPEFDETLQRMSRFIVDQIPDGATIQLGIGGVSGAVGLGLREKNDLGVHSEMLTDSMMELIEAGVITNRAKSFFPGKAVAGFAFGSQALYRFIDRNPELYFAPYTFVNDPRIIAQNDNMISVNTAMAVDLYGQVYADCIGGRQQSAVGGQLDYVRGAQMSKGGKSFLALPSTWKTRDGETRSRIVVQAELGSAVTTPRADVQYVVTEYGCVNLKPLTMSQRAQALIGLAHPDFREKLTEDAGYQRLL